MVRPTSQISIQLPLSTTVNFQRSFRIVPKKSLKLQSLKPSCIEFPPSDLVFVRRFGCEESASKKHRNWGYYGMDELSGSSSMIKCGNGDEGFRSLETESFFDRSEFAPEVAAGGLEAILNKLSKWLVAALFGAIILWRHDAEAMWIAMGSVLNATLSMTLKRILNQERPFATLRPDPGMPSSHAQSIFFTVVFVALSVVEALGVNEISSSICGLAFIFGSYFSWLRISQKLHTLSQVLVGAVLGSCFSLLWYWSWKAVVMEAFADSLWVQIVVILGASSFCIAFLIYVIQNWFRDEKFL